MKIRSGIDWVYVMSNNRNIPLIIIGISTVSADISFNFACKDARSGVLGAKDDIGSFKAGGTR